MMHHNRTTSLYRSHAWVRLLTICCCSGSVLQSVRAQEPISPKVTIPPAQTFAKDLKILSQRLGVAFVAEGEPFPKTKEDPAPSLRETLSAEDAVKEVADYFDYSFVREGNVYLLKKRYTSVDDLPDLTPLECQNALKAVTKVIATFNPKIPPGTFAGDPMANIAQLLSAAQKEKLSTSGLPVSDLTVSQRAEVWKLALKFYIQDRADPIEANYSRMENRNPADPVFHWQTIKNIYAFGYDTRSIPLNQIVFVTLSNSDKIVVEPDGTIIQHTLTNNRTGAVVATQDPTDPGLILEPIQALLDAKPKSSDAISLSEAITALNTRINTPGAYKVDVMYAPKHVTLVGEEILSAETLMHSLAAVYGLRVALNEDGSFILTHLLAVEANQLSELGRALRSVVPEPIFRMLRTQDVSTDDKVKIERTLLSSDYENRAGASSRSAMRMFRYIAERAVKSSPEKRLALSHLNEQARNLFAISYTLGSFAEAGWIADRTIPPYITDFDHVILTGGIYNNAQGAERLSLFLSYKNPTSGVTSRGVGFSNAIIPQH